MTKQQILMEQVAQLGYTWDQLITDMELKGCKLSLPTVRSFMDGIHCSYKTLCIVDKYCQELDKITVESAEGDLI